MINTLEYAIQLDVEDPLKGFREQFFIPLINGKESIYFTGNSLGLQPKTTQEYILNELEDWANFGVEGHFHATNPWLSYHEIFPQQLSKIIGSKTDEVVVMNQLTINLTRSVAVSPLNDRGSCGGRRVEWSLKSTSFYSESASLCDK